MHIKLSIPEHGPATWSFVETPNSIPVEIGVLTSFQVSARENNLPVYYTLNHTPIVMEATRVEAILVKTTVDTVKVMGRVKLSVDKLEGWVNKMVGQIVGNPKSQAVELAAQVLADLQKLSENGLQKPYLNYDEYLADMWANLPWDERGQIVALKWILSNPSFELISQKIKKEWYGGDLKALFEATIAAKDGDVIDPANFGFK